MDERVLEFAERMRAKADALGETAGVEWRLSPALVPYEAAVSEMEERAEAKCCRSRGTTRGTSGAAAGASNCCLVPLRYRLLSAGTGLRY